MPEISRFLGIVITMHYKEHLPPHFHAKYGEHRAEITIGDLRLIVGRLPRRVLSLVLEWAFEHRDELQRNWEHAQNREELERIEGLV